MKKSATKEQNPKQIFYEQAYPKRRRIPIPKDFLGRLYLLLKRFEHYREDVVFDSLPEGKRFLDVGCGEGNLVFRAQDKFRYVYGLDIARTRLTKASQKKDSLSSSKRDKVKFIHADADKKLPFSDNFFDAVAMVATLEHFFDPYYVISEIRRTLTPQGFLIIQVPNLCFLPRRIAVLFGNLPETSEDETGWDGGHLHYFTVSSLKELLANYHFKIKEVTCSGIFADLRSKWVSLLGSDIVILAQK